MSGALQLGLAATALWAAAFAIGSRVGMTLQALALVSVAVVLAVARAIDLRPLLQPRRSDLLIGVGVGLGSIGATLALYPVLRALVPIAEPVRAFYALVPFSAAGLPLILLVASAEELLWRGLFLSALRRSPVAAAIAISALAYGIGQLGGAPLLGAVALVFGVIWGIEAKLTNGLVAPLISHVMWTTAIFGVFPLER